MDMEMRERKLFSARELPFFAVLFLIAAAVWLALGQTPRGAVAVVEVEGWTVERRELGLLSGPETVEVRGAAGILLTVEFSPEGARVVSAGCPDKTCQRTGMVTRVGESAVCLPGRVVVRLEGAGGKEVDAATY